MGRGTPTFSPRAGPAPGDTTALECGLEGEEWVFVGLLVYMRTYFSYLRDDG